MSEVKRYLQCRMTKPVQGSSHVITETTGWIEARGAKVGLQVQLLPDRAFWTVEEVFHPDLAEDILRETQRQRRTVAPSIRGKD